MDGQAAHFIPNAEAFIFHIRGVNGCIFERERVAFRIIFYFSLYAGYYREIIAVVIAYIPPTEFEFILGLCLCLLRQNKRR